MKISELWKEAYVAAIKAGLPQSSYSSIADDAVTQYKTRQPGLIADDVAEAAAQKAAHTAPAGDKK